MVQNKQNDGELFDQLQLVRAQLLEAIGTVVVGQDEVIDLMLTALFANGHSLFIGVPGLAKTLLVQTLADAIGATFKRIQFTPDLMPSDITGTELLTTDGTGERTLKFVKGPVFTNLLLADEINRTPPKTQAALLEALSEGAVTAAGVRYELTPPFLAFATQNPIEQEGTYPLPEAQLDRFMFSIPVGYPSKSEEEQIVRRTTIGQMPTVSPVLEAAHLVAYQSMLRRLPITNDVVKLAVKLASATRPVNGADAAKWVRWGAGPRASQYLAVGARARAALRGHEVATTADLIAVASPVLRHRIVLSFEAEAASITPDQVVASLIDEVI